MGTLKETQRIIFTGKQPLKQKHDDAINATIMFEGYAIEKSIVKIFPGSK